MLDKELKVYKVYINKNLSKGFIKASLALFALLVLFAYKGDRGLRFYIDYRKLNAITKKD